MNRLRLWSVGCLAVMVALIAARAARAEIKVSVDHNDNEHAKPEFKFEHDVDNVRWAVGARKIDYPVAIDGLRRRTVQSQAASSQQPCRRP